MTSERRVFEINRATRQQVPLFIGVFGASSSGKTFSMMRLARGIQRVRGGKIVVVDTEARRALHYADRFEFEHMPFGAPFGPLDYLDACEAAVASGASVVVVDSGSHMHEGPGGLLEQHAANVYRMAGDDWKKAERVKMAAWIQPKQDFRRFVNTLLQLDVVVIMGFRAKEKIKPVKGGEPEDQGWMPIISDELPYEMTINALLEPGCNGVPNWEPQEKASRGMVKLPEQFRPHFLGKRGAALDEADGEFLAKWARGEDAIPRFRSNKEWMGKPLSEAPAEVLVAYKKACDSTLPKKTGAAADDMRKHIADIDREIESRLKSEAASGFSLETPPDDVEQQRREHEAAE